MLLPVVLHLRILVTGFVYLTKELDMIRLSYEQNATLKEYVRENWARILEHRPSHKKFMEELQKELNFTVPLGSLKRIIRQLDKRWPYLRRTKLSQAKKFVIANREKIEQGRYTQETCCDLAAQEYKRPFCPVTMADAWQIVTHTMWPKSKPEADSSLNSKSDMREILLRIEEKLSLLIEVWK